jgi:quercetin dioxygenase-like cupin family protein
MERDFKNYGIIDVSNFKKILAENEFDWDEFDYRQKKFHVHKETKTIPLLFDEAFEIGEKTEQEHYHLFKDEIKRIEALIQDVMEEQGFIFRAILVKLPAGKGIPPHIDKGESLAIPRRIHIPILTNKDCFFTVGEVTKNLKEGYVWEINNNGRRHGVANNGETDRVHLIVDWLKK